MKDRTYSNQIVAVRCGPWERHADGRSCRPDKKSQILQVERTTRHPSPLTATA
jgi:hypothetical protein